MGTRAQQLISSNASEIRPECFILMSRRSALTDSFTFNTETTEMIKDDGRMARTNEYQSEENGDSSDDDDVFRYETSDDSRDHGAHRDEHQPGNTAEQRDDHQLNKLVRDEDDNDNIDKIDDKEDDETERILVKMLNLESRASIADDPWCSDLPLVLGATYRFIGQAPKLLSSDSLLRLVAFLPADDCDLPTEKQPYTRGPYVCRTKDCDAGCKRSGGNAAVLYPFDESGTFVTPSGGRLTRCCGLSPATTSCRRINRHPRLLMLRLVTRDDEFQLKGDDYDKTRLMILSRVRYRLSRCNSLWTPNLYTRQCAREGMWLFGYPLVLNSGVSSWRVQGETISKSDVYVNLNRMTKQQALVSLSRVRRSEQIKGVINLETYGSSD